MQRMNIRLAVGLIIGVLLIAADATAQQGFRTNQLLLDDNATALGDRNTITLLSPITGTLTADYALRFPSQTNMATGSLLFAGTASGTSADLSWLAPGTTDQVLIMNAAGDAPEWQDINLIPTGTTESSTLRWDNTNSVWVENTNLLSDATGNTTINGTTITTPNIPAGLDGEIDVVIRNAGDELVVRTIDDLIGDATLSENAIWVGDASNNPEERAAGTTDQVLQIDASGAPQWQDINLVHQGRVATGGTLTQTIAATQVTATATINVSYEDPSNGARVAIDVIGRAAGTSFNVGFSALPPAGTFINYTVIP